MGAILYKRLGAFAPLLRLELGTRLMAERDRWPLWIPVFLGAGTALYFGWASEPPVWLGPLVLGCAAAVTAAARRRPAAAIPALAIALIALGFTATAARTREVAAPVLRRPSGAVTVAGTVARVEEMSDGGQRITLDRVDAPLTGPGPARVRLRVRDAGPALAVGSRIAVRAAMIPPPAPNLPGAYDFARTAWYLGLGATGLALGPAEVLAPARPDGWRQRLDALRQIVAARVRAVLPGPAGGVAIALTTGQTTGIPREVLDTYRDTGLAHILVIAGLHMGMVAGLVFFVVRGGLALVPRIALRHPVKKWAAAAALVVIGAYDLLAGLPLPATRAFIMAAVVLLAVLMDRPTLTMRLWALAATAILLTRPEQLVGPSFQMSFAAVGCLIATYEALGPRLAALGRRIGGRTGRITLYLLRLALTSLAAGGATAVYGLYHFNRLAIYQVVANLLAVPVTGVAVMPFAVAALALMPLGLDSLALVPLGWGIGAVDSIAAWVASWPHAVFPVPPLPTWGLLTFSAGGLWLCLWRGSWRVWGVAAMAAGLAGLATVRPPDLVVDGHARAFGVRLADGSLLISSRSRLLREVWGRRAGPPAHLWWPKHGRTADGRLSCDPGLCLYRKDGRVAALVLNESGLDAACAGPELVIAAIPVRGACPGARQVIDRFDLWRRGAHAIWLEADGGLRVEDAAGWQGDRPWTFQPRPRGRSEDESPPPL